MRRAAQSRNKHVGFPVSAGDGRDVSELNGLTAEARRHYRQGQVAQARLICNQILARQPSHIPSLNLLALIAQAAGRHNLAIKMFSQALALDQFNAACHYNIASSYQSLNRPDDAITHFKKAVLYSMSDEKLGELILQNPTLEHISAESNRGFPILRS